jgi:hypothetical protein
VLGPLAGTLVTFTCSDHPNNITASPAAIGSPEAIRKFLAKIHATALSRNFEISGTITR